MSKRKRRKRVNPARPPRVPLLRYEDAAALRRRVIRRRLVAALGVLIAAKLLVDHLGERAWNGALSLFWQQRCMSYQLPRERIAYVAAPHGTALPAYLGDFSRGIGSTWAGTIGAAPYPVELAELQKLIAPASGVPWDKLPGPVFLHGLRNARGERKLVTVYALANNPAGWWTLVAAVRDPGGPRGAARQVPVLSTACWPMPRTPGDTLIVYAGQPAPNDASRFTIRIALNGKMQTVTGVLQSDGTIVFTSTSGLPPWDAERAGRVVVPVIMKPVLARPVGDVHDNVLLPTD